MSVAAGVVGNALMAAMIAGFDVPTQNGRAAILHSVQYAPLRGRAAILRQILVSMLSEHIGHFEPMSSHVVDFSAASAVAF
jgi:inner membrane protein involved in colicin E2 resistance